MKRPILNYGTPTSVLFNMAMPNGKKLGHCTAAETEAMVPMLQQLLRFCEPSPGQTEDTLNDLRVAAARRGLQIERADVAGRFILKSTNGNFLVSGATLSLKELETQLAEISASDRITRVGFEPAAHSATAQALSRLTRPNR